MAFGNSFDLKAVLSADISNFEQGMKRASDVMKDFQNNTRGLSQVAEGMKSVGKKLMLGVTAPLVGLGIAAVKVGTEYEASMSKVQALSGATGNDLKRLEDIAREMGATTRYSASEAADALSYMALAGWDTEQMIAALPSVLNLATAGQLDLAQASDIVTDMMSMFGLEAGEASRATDVFATAQANSNTNVSQLGEALKNTGSMAAAAGQSLEDTSAVLGILADNGIKGGEAGTALNAMFMDLQSAAQDGAVAIGESSVAIYDAEGNMRSIVDIMRDFESATEGMTQEQRNNELASIFQRRSLKGVNTIMNEGTDSLVDLQSELYNSTGAAENMAKTMDDNLQGSFYNLRSALEEVALSFMDFAGGPIRELIDGITDVVRWFGELDPAIQQWMTIIAAAAAAVGPLLFVIGSLVGWFLKLKTFIMLTGTSLGVLAGGFVLIVAKILAVIAIVATFVGAIIYLWNTNEEFRVAVIDIWNGIKEGIQMAWEALSAYLQPAIQAVVDFVKEIFGGLVEWWKENNEMILQAAQNVWSVISMAIQTAMSVIMSIMQTVWPFIEMLVVFTWNAIKDVIQGAITVITGIIEFFSALFTGNWSALWESVKQIVSGVVQLIWGLIKLWFVIKIIALAKTLLVSLKAIVTTIWATIKSIFTGGLQFIFGKVSSVFSSISGIIKTIMGSIRSTISTILNAIKTVFSNILSSIVNSVTSRFSKVASAFSKGMSSALRTVTSFVSKFFKAGANIVGNIAKGITSAVGKVTDAISGVLSKARNLLPFSPPKDKSSPLVDIHKNGIVEQIAKGITNNAGDLERAASSALYGVQSALNAQSLDASLGLDSALARANTQVNGNVRHEVGKLDVAQRPAYINLSIGGQQFTAFVENISNEQGRLTDLDMQF